MNDAFLLKVRVATETDAMRNSLRAALQHNPVYREGVHYKSRREIRMAWAAEILRYVSSYRPHVSEEEHISHIERISRSLSERYGDSLRGARLRIGTSQKALNLYLKFLWRLGKLSCPPHCPVDGIVLRRAKLSGSWTASDSVDEYKSWICDLRKKAAPQCLAEWEYQLWNEKPA